jgi:selenide, water dikinase
MDRVKLTAMAACAGWAAKLDPGKLAQVLRPLRDIFPIDDYPALLVGLSQPDDAAVYKLDGERALVSTVDFFPPVVDDPYAFGAIAAANALSDIYAMGAEPLVAINLVGFPDGLDLAILTEILRGGAEKVRETGAVIAGGHTVTDREPKYGLAVTGLIHPGRVLSKGGARPGDILILTKPLGAGVVTTALKQERAQEADVTAAIQSMSHLNRTASRLAREFAVHAMTDITGYSLLGHGHEMAHLSNAGLRIRYSALNWLPGAERYGEDGIFPGGMGRNRDFFEQWTQFDESIPDWKRHLLFDPETSGGLLMAIGQDAAQRLYQALVDAGEPAQIIGAVIEGEGGIEIVPWWTRRSWHFARKPIMDYDLLQTES